MRTLIIYGTKYGCTEKAASLLAGKLSGETTLVNITNQAAPDLGEYDNIVIGGSIYAGQIQPAVKQFCEKHTEELKGKKLGLFTCAANREQSEVQLKSNFPNALLDTARTTGHFGYAIQMGKMNFFERTIIKVLMKTRESSEQIALDAISRFAEELVS